MSATGVVGRHAERAALREALDAARSGRGTAVLLAGDPGIGKTTLLEWVVTEAAATDVRVHWGRCWEGGGAAAYWPWVHVLRSVVADRGDHRLGGGAADVARIVPELAARLGAPDPRPRRDDPDARARLFEAATTFLLDAAREAPLLLALDDLHAADDASLLLLAHLSARLEGAPVLVVGAYREAEARASPRLGRLLGRVSAGGQLLELTGLEEREVATLVRGSTGEAEVTALARRLHQVTDGNPFFVLESTRLLAAERAAGGDRPPLPDEVHALVRRRLNGLDDRARRVLASAAVVGRDFDQAVLREATGLPLDVLVDALGTAASGRVVEETGLGRWSFAHAVLRETLYDDLAAPERARLHGRVADALERAHAGDLDARAAELAHHYCRSSDPGHRDRAVRCCEVAGRAAAAAFAHEEAALLFRRALDALAQTPGAEQRRRTELLLALGEATARSGDFGGARTTFRRAFKAARADGSSELVGRAALGVAGEIETVSDRERVAVLREALAVVGEADAALRARLLLSLAGTLHRGWPRDNAGEVRALNDEAVEMARRSGDPEMLLSVLLAWHLNAAFHGHETLERRLAVADELAERSATAGDLRTLAFARHWRTVDLFEAGEIDEMEAELDRAAALARQLREPFLLWTATYPRATLALLRGELADAERLAREALAAGERTEFTDMEAMFSGQMSEIRYQQGRLAGTEEATRRRPWRLKREQEDPSIFLARLLAEVGRSEEARRVYDCVYDDAVAGRQNIWVLLARAVVADTCWALGDAAGAASLYECLRPLAGRHVVNGIAGASHGSVDRHLGCLATLLGRFDDAERHFEAAHRMHARMGARPWLAHGWVAHARMLLARAGPGDSARAVALLTDARKAFRAMGMGPWDERAAALLAGVAEVDRGTFRREGEGWALEYRGARSRLRDSKGLEYLATLLARPGEQVAATEVTGVEDPESARQRVTRALRGTIRRIADVDADLARHLQATVRAGRMSSYGPDPAAPISWDVGPIVAEDATPAR